MAGYTLPPRHMVDHYAFLCSTDDPRPSSLSCLKSLIDVFPCALVWEMSEMIWINFASFISASWGILITCLVCFRTNRFKCPLRPLSLVSFFLSFFLFFFFSRCKWGGSKNLCFINGLKTLTLLSQWEEEWFEGRANYNCRRSDLGDATRFNLCCIGICFSPWQPFCSLHLHLEMLENPYTSGPITSKKSVPGIIVATGGVTWINVTVHLIRFTLCMRIV